MAAHGGFLICFLLATLGTCQGMQLLSERDLKGPSCGYVLCWNDVHWEENYQSTINMTIYDVTDPEVKYKLASTTINSTEVFVEESKKKELIVTGLSSGDGSFLLLYFLNTTDCFKGVFQCEIHFVNVRDQHDVIQETTAFHENCTKGMVHHSSREKFLLKGQELALCDTETDGGGWVIIQRRTHSEQNFYRSWNEYKTGFGNTDTDFWIGNDIIHDLTSQGYNELRIDLELDGRKFFAHYSNFSISDESSNYTLLVSGYSGTAGDSLAPLHNGMQFTTFDRDNDEASSGNCAHFTSGAWWYKDCHTSNLNGVWGKHDEGGIIWHGIGEFKKSMTTTEMKIRRS